jgi:hypothetical protein
MGKSTISMAIFNSELLVYQRVTMKIWDFTNNGGKIWESQIKNMGVLSGYNEAKKQ